MLPATAGTTSTAGSVATTAGTSSVVPTAGTSSGGTFASTGGTFSMAGTGVVTGGTGGSDAAGTGGTTTAAGTANGGTGGVIVATPYCMGKTLEALPFPVNKGWQPSGWSAGPPLISAPMAADVTTDYCAAGQRVGGAAAVSDCSRWRYTPAVAPTAAWVIWSYVWDAQFTHPGVCLAEGAKAIAFCARGAAGGEAVAVGGAGVTEIPITLTADWKAYSVPLGAEYNGFDNGVPSGFDWKIDPVANQPTVTFFIDKLQFVKDVPADYCGASAGGGGSGGTGGGGSGGGGTGGGGNGGTGGN